MPDVRHVLRHTSQVPKMQKGDMQPVLHKDRFLQGLLCCDKAGHSNKMVSGRQTKGLMCMIMFFALSFAASASFNSTGLISLYQFDNDTSDSWGAYDPYNYGGLTFQTQGISNQTARFDGVNDFMNISHGGKLRGAKMNNVSISVWYNASSPRSQADENDIYSAWNGGNSYFLRYDSANNQIDWVIDVAGSHTISANVNIEDNQFHHIVALRNHSYSLVLWIDGNMTISDVVTGDISGQTSNNLIGVFSEGLNDDLNGSLDDLAIFNRTLTDSEILSIYYNGTNGTGLYEMIFPAAAAASNTTTGAAEYNVSLIPSSWVNNTFDITTTAGVLLLFFLLFVCVFTGALGFFMQIGAIVSFSGFLWFFFGWIVAFAISYVFGIILILVGILFFLSGFAVARG